MDGDKKQQLPIVVDYDITTGILSPRVHWKSTLKLLCPHCIAQLKTRYQGPSDPDDCPECGKSFFISPKKLIAAIQKGQHDNETLVAETLKNCPEEKELKRRAATEDEWFCDENGIQPLCSSERPPVRKPAITPQSSRNEMIAVLAIVGSMFLAAHLWLTSESQSLSTSSKKTSSDAIVYNSYLDGSVYQVESWLRQNLKDPESLEFIEWYKVVERKDGSFSVVVEYRAKNGFGGFNVEKMKFFLDSKGNITDHSDY